MTTVDSDGLPNSCIPNVYCAIVACGGEELLRWRPSHGVYYVPDVTAVDSYQLIGNYIPNPYQRIATGRGNAHAIG